MIERPDSASATVLPDRRLIGLLLDLLRPHRAAAAAMLGVGLLASLFEGVGLGLFVPFLYSLDLGSTGAVGGGWFGRTFGGLFPDLPARERLATIALLRTVRTVGSVLSMSSFNNLLHALL